MEIDVSEYGSTIVIKLRGEFYLSSVKDVEATWSSILKKNPLVVGIDCKHLAFVDSSAIGTLVKFMNNAAQHDITMVFFDLNALIVKVFDTAKLSRVFTISTWREFKGKYIHE